MVSGRITGKGVPRLIEGFSGAPRSAARRDIGVFGVIKRTGELEVQTGHQLELQLTFPVQIGVHREGAVGASKVWSHCRNCVPCRTEVLSMTRGSIILHKVPLGASKRKPMVAAESYRFAAQ
jgi:hypothetical protein